MSILVEASKVAAARKNAMRRKRRKNKPKSMKRKMAAKKAARHRSKASRARSARKASKTRKKRWGKRRGILSSMEFQGPILSEALDMVAFAGESPDEILMDLVALLG